jgi:hypothetical protein
MVYLLPVVIDNEEQKKFRTTNNVNNTLPIRFDQRKLFSLFLKSVKEQNHKRVETIEEYFKSVMNQSLSSCYCLFLITIYRIWISLLSSKYMISSLNNLEKEKSVTRTVVFSPRSVDGFISQLFQIFWVRRPSKRFVESAVPPVITIIIITLPYSFFLRILGR